MVMVLLSHGSVVTLSKCLMSCMAFENSIKHRNPILIQLLDALIFNLFASFLLDK